MPLCANQARLDSGRSSPTPPTRPTWSAQSLMPKAVCGPPPPSVFMAVWPSGKTISSMMREKVTKSICVLLFTNYAGYLLHRSMQGLIQRLFPQCDIDGPANIDLGLPLDYPQLIDDRHPSGEFFMAGNIDVMAAALGADGGFQGNGHGYRVG